MDRQSILQKYEYDEEFEIEIENYKEAWAVKITENIAQMKKIRKQTLERFFHKLQRHEIKLNCIKDDCDKAKKSSDLQKFEIFVDYYESAFNVEKSRFSQVFKSEIMNVSKYYNGFEEFLTDSEWSIYGNSAELKSRDKQLQLCRQMMHFFSRWHEMFLQHEFYDAGAHRMSVFYPDADM